MRYVSLFSGIEAASVAWEPLGWEPMAFAEIEPFPCAVLAERFPDVPNLGDVCEIDWRDFVERNGRPDVVVGGSPCQAFSVAGRRLGLMDARGLLMLEFIRCVREAEPRWVVWENVPGVLSQDGGRAFGALLGELEDCGYALAWRVLDAQFFGVPQRRRRVFLVGHHAPGCAAGVLFEPDCMRGDNPPSREKRQELAAVAGRGAARGGGGRLTPSGFIDKADASAGSGVYAIVGNIIGREDGNGGNGLGWESDGACYTLTSADRHAVAFAQNSRDEVRLVGGDGQVAGALAASPGMKQTTYVLESTQSNSSVDADVCGCVTAHAAKDAPVVCTQHGNIAGTLTARHDSSPCADRGAEAVASNGQEIVSALCARDCKGVGSQYVTDGKVITQREATHYVVRRLTPVECERLQGFPDGWTKVPYRGKAADECPDTPRYKALGNSMAVPVMRWIGGRIGMVDEIGGGDR